jgi:hypothetical protein
MSPTRKLPTLVLAAWALQAIGANTIVAQNANPPLTAGEIVITEFFKDMYRIDPGTGAKSSMTPGAFDPGDAIEIDGARQVIAVDKTDRLVRFNPATLGVAPLAPSVLLPGATDLAIEPSGTILVLSQSDIVRVNPVTGQATTLVNHLNVNGGFFGPSGIAVGPTGRIFVTEFFESAWEINASTGNASKLPLSREISHGSTIKVRSDGDLIVRESNSALLRVSPDTGAISFYWYGLPGFPKDFALEADDDVILTSSLGLFHYDASTGQQSPLTMIGGDDFFGPEAIAIAPDGDTGKFVGDFDEDGDVDHDDFGKWRTGFGLAAGAGKSHGDANVDGDVDGGDFLDWQRHVGATPLAAVPEPATLALVGLALVAVGGGRRRQAMRST